MNLAPIGIVTYSRIEHLTKTVNSLKNNALARNSELYIFLDAPRKGDEEKVALVRNYIYTINGFKKVHIIEREKNDLIQNALLGIAQMLKEHGKFIFMEDDNIVSEDFLVYINNGLDYYENDKKIMAICGFNVPVSRDKYPKDYKHDYYLSNDFCAAGFATWESRNILDILSYNDCYNELINDKNLYKKFKKTSPYIINELKRIQDGTLNAGDYKITFNMIKNDMFVIKPIESKVNNIGYDGSGVHCEASDKFDNQVVSNKVIEFKKNVVFDKRIEKIWRNFFDKKPPFFKRVKKKINNLLSKYKKS